MNKNTRNTKSNKMAKSLKSLLTVRELKTWLDGYCSAHGEDWSPTSEQWEIIKTKIFSLQETADVKTSNASAISPVALPPQQFVPQQFQYSTEPAQPAGGLVGLTDRPPMIVGQGGSLKTPDKGEPGGPSDFA